MHRRQLIQSLAAVSGHAMFPAVLSSFLTSCSNQDMTGYKPVFFSPENFRSLPEIIDIIIPATQTKSASQVNAHVFLDQVFAACMTAEEQAGLQTGIQSLIPAFKQAKDKHQFILDLDQKAYAGDASAAYFKNIKQYTMIGFFTSDEGETKASNYVKIPGDYKGEIPLDDHTLNFGKTFLHY